MRLVGRPLLTEIDILPPAAGGGGGGAGAGWGAGCGGGVCPGTCAWAAAGATAAAAVRTRTSSGRRFIARGLYREPPTANPLIRALERRAAGTAAAPGPARPASAARPPPTPPSRCSPARRRP